MPGITLEDQQASACPGVRMGRAVACFQVVCIGKIAERRNQARGDSDVFAVMRIRRCATNRGRVQFTPCPEAAALNGSGRRAGGRMSGVRKRTRSNTWNSDEEFGLARTATEKRSRAPQGAKRVAQAFFSELETITEDKQAEVAKAAQAMVRESMMARREKAKAARTKTAQTKPRAGKPAPASSRAKATPERAARGPSRKRKAPVRRARSVEPDADNAQETVEASEET